MSAPIGKIDVHHHFLPEVYISSLASAGVTDSTGVPFPEWSPDVSLDLMDRFGIASAVTSISAPGIYFGDVAFARDLARRCNEASAELVAGHPDRFGAMAVLPLPDVDASLAELEYAMDTLSLDGVALLSSVDDLNRRKAVAFMHPGFAPGGKARSNLPPSLVEFVFETTMAVSNLVFSGTLERCPDIKLILPHAGGTVPYIALRMCVGQFWPGLAESVPQGVMTYLRRLYYDTALSASPHALRSLQELVEPSHILFASDYPFAPELATGITVGGLDDYDGFDEEALAWVYRKSALGLFPRFGDPDDA
jgi:6-methylsalicylate decarboxylase